MIEPNIDKLNTFINELSTQTSKSLKTIKDNLNSDSYLKIKSEELKQNKVIISEFEFDFIEMFKRTYPLVYSELKDLQMNLTDTITEHLDTTPHHTNIDEIEKSIKQFKSKFLHVLYSEISKQ